MSAIASRDEAEARLREHLAASAATWVIDPERTVEHPVGWAFVLTSPEFLRTRDFQHAPIGLGPVIVTRRGEMFGGGSGQPLSVSLDDVAAITGTAGVVGRLRFRWRRMLRGPMVSRLDGARVA